MFARKHAYNGLFVAHSHVLQINRKVDAKRQLTNKELTIYLEKSLDMDK